MQPVDSSSLAAVGFDDAARELWVEFASGATYVYADVPQRVYEELLAAGSKGSYFNRAIRNAYAFRKM
jgi:hypothetical protein